MSLLQGYDVEKLKSEIKNLYSSIDIRSLIIKDEEKWINVYSMIIFTRRNILDLQKEHQNIIDNIGVIDHPDIKIIMQVFDINHTDFILTQLKEGYLKIGDIRAHTFVKLIENNRKLHRIHFDLSGELREFDTYGFTLEDQENLSRYYGKLRRLISRSGIKNEDVLFRSWFNLSRHDRKDNVTIVFPIYSKIISIIIKNNYDVEFNVKIDEKLYDDTKIWVNKLSSENNLRTILERNTYDIRTLKSTLQDKYYYVQKICSFRGLNYTDIVEVVVSNDKYGILDEEDTYLQFQKDDKKHTLHKAFSLFDGSRKLDMNITDPENSKIFEKTVSWLLELLGINVIHLDIEGEILREGSVSKGSADILGYNKSSNYIYTIDCTITPPNPEKIDKIRNTAEYIARKKGVKTKPILFCGVNCPTVKKEAENSGVLIIDLEDIKKMYQIYKEGKYRSHVLERIFNDEIEYLEELNDDFVYDL